MASHFYMGLMGIMYRANSKLRFCKFNFKWFYLRVNGAVNTGQAIGIQLT